MDLPTAPYALHALRSASGQACRRSRYALPRSSRNGSPGSPERFVRVVWRARRRELSLSHFTDINAAAGNGQNNRVFELNGRLIFAASAAATGKELFELNPESVFKIGFKVK